MAKPEAPKPTPAPTPPTNAQWTCKTSAMDETGTPAGDLGEITVGDKFLLTCEGPPATLKREALSLETSKEARFALRILETKALSDSRGEFIATSWVANEFTLENPVLTDGQMRVGLGDIKLKVATVIKPEQNPEGKPFPPWAPASLPLPMWVWAAAFVFVLAIAAAAAFKLMRRARRQRFLRRLESNRPALTPYNQFNKDLRRLVRGLPLSGSGLEPQKVRGFLEELSEALRWFLARELLVDTLKNQKAGEILRSLRTQDRELYDHLKKDMHLTLTEIDKAIGAAGGGKGAPPLEDLHQIAELGRKLTDKVQRGKTERGASA